jgi:hypothetical protein
VKKLFLIFSIFFITHAYSRVNNDGTSIFWNNIISTQAPKELREIRLIEKKDINSFNIDAFNSNNPSILIKYDLNNNGKIDFVLPCISKEKKNTWYILIFEKDKDKFNFIKSFEFNIGNIYVFLATGKNRKMIRVGENFASDYSEYIYWNGKEYIRKVVTLD